MGKAAAEDGRELEDGAASDSCNPFPLLEKRDLLGQCDVEMGLLTPGNNENGPEQVQLHIQPADTKETPENKEQIRLRTRLEKWCKANPKKCMVIAVITFIAAITILGIFLGHSNLLPHNSTQEVGTDNTTANMGNQTVGNQWPHLSSSNNTFPANSQPGESEGTYCLLDDKTYFIAGKKVNWSEAKEYCRGKGAQLLTHWDNKTLEAVQPHLQDYSYWVDPPSGTWNRRSESSCPTLHLGKTDSEMCKDTKRFICQFGSEL